MAAVPPVVPMDAMQGMEIVFSHGKMYDGKNCHTAMAAKLYQKHRIR
jgi:hypothetical protein